MESHTNILAQLAELKRWHDEHCDGEDSINSNTRSTTTAGLSPDDQAQIYKMLGLTPSFINEIELSQSSPSAVLNNSLSPREEAVATEDPVNHLKITNNLSGTSPPRAVVKRPFLKRGQGLTNRFKIHPDQYKLQNLPKYKFAGPKSNPGKPKISKPPPPALAVEKQTTAESETPFKYNIERTRKSCLKTDSFVQLDELRVKMTELCTNAIKDDSEELDSVPAEEENEMGVDDNVKRMLDFSRKSPRVTFHSEVTKIPFENYFYPREEVHLGGAPNAHAEEEEEEDEEDEAPTESIRCEFNVDAAFQKHAFISTPVDVFKEKHQQPQAHHVEKSPRTQLVEKGSMLRDKIKELEEETHNFREQNRQVQKMKQSIELEKVQLGNQRKDLERAFKEQHLKMELDHEKLKEALEEERHKLEQRCAVPSKKMREETKILRDKVDELEKELKNREVKHGASQTRLRCHIRTLEKENRETLVAMETLKKENKRLETENSRLLRQKNNKMLSEINKNIAKLATTKPTEEVKSGDVKRAATGRKTETTSAKEVVIMKRNLPSVNLQAENEGDERSISSQDEDTDNDSVEPIHPQSNYFPVVSTSCSPRRQPVATVSESENKENKKELQAHLNETTTGPKREIVNEDGSKTIYYPNGNLKKISGDGMVVKVLYFNKDIKETNINEGTVKYYYAETKTWHTSYLDGLEILEFPSGQTEHRYKNGMVEIYFPNGLVRVTNPKDSDVVEEWRYPDGTVVIETKAKEKIIKMPNGQKEIHTAEHKRREYPDGTVKLVYSDGRTETRYSNGRVRIKDKEGQLISDSQNGT